jgi:hypothetical protein
MGHSLIFCVNIYKNMGTIFKRQRSREIITGISVKKAKPILQTYHRIKEWEVTLFICYRKIASWYILWISAFVLSEGSKVTFKFLWFGNRPGNGTPNFTAYPFKKCFTLWISVIDNACLGPATDQCSTCQGFTVSLSKTGNLQEEEKEFMLQKYGDHNSCLNSDKLMTR